MVRSTVILMFVCLSGRIFNKLHFQTSQNFLYKLPTAIARSSADDSAICYVFPVLWMTSGFHIMGHIQTQAIGESFTVTPQLVPLIAHPG